MQMGPSGYHRQLRKPRHHCGNGSTIGTQGRGAESAEDQHIVEAQVYCHCGNTGDHGNHRLACLPEGAGIGVGQSKGDHTNEHDLQVFHGAAPGGFDGGDIALALEVQVNQPAAAEGKHCKTHSCQCRNNQKLEPEGMADTLMILIAVKLGSEDARAGHRAENAHIEDEENAIDDGNAAHGGSAHLANHHVVKKGHEIGNGILNHNRQCHRQNPADKGSVADDFLKHWGTSDWSDFPQL